MRSSPAAAPSQYGWVSGVGTGTALLRPAIGILLGGQSADSDQRVGTGTPNSASSSCEHAIRPLRSAAVAWHSPSAASAITDGGSALGSSLVVRWWNRVPGVGTTLLGDRAFTATPDAYSSAASPVLNRSMAALHMPYTVPPRNARSAGGSAGCRAAREEMFRIQPWPRSLIPGATSWARWVGAVTWTSNISANRRGVNSWIGV